MDHTTDTPEELRRRRLVFYSDDVEEIDRCLEAFLERSKANCALLIDIEGHLVTKKGFTQSLNTDSIAALVAGSFASTRALAEKLGERNFSVIFHQGNSENIQIGLVADRCLIVVIFDDRTTIGMVRLHAREVTEELTAIVETMTQKNANRPSQLNDADFKREAEARLDEFFAEE